MIFRRYGTSFQSVDINFDSKALNEVGFRRNREDSIPSDDFDGVCTLVESHELVAQAEGEVQDHTEQALLDQLEAQLVGLRDGLTEGQILVVENEQGHDWPKTKQSTSNVIVQGENRLHFSYTVAPALRIGVYTRGA